MRGRRRRRPFRPLRRLGAAVGAEQVLLVEQGLADRALCQVCSLMVAQSRLTCPRPTSTCRHKNTYQSTATITAADRNPLPRHRLVAGRLARLAVEQKAIELVLVAVAQQDRSAAGTDRSSTWLNSVLHRQAAVRVARQECGDVALLPAMKLLLATRRASSRGDRVLLANQPARKPGSYRFRAGRLNGLIRSGFAPAAGPGCRRPDSRCSSR